MKLSIIGASGLLGKRFLKSIQENQYESVTAIARRNLDVPEFICQSIQSDLSDPTVFLPSLQSDCLVCCWGTTIKKAGSKAEFTRIDHDIPLAIIKAAVQQTCKYLIIISSIGADPSSANFYLRSKGNLDAAVSALDYEKIFIIRPGLLLGEREESRVGERVAQYIAPSLKFLFPSKYKPIHDSQISKVIHHILANIASYEKKVNILQGNDLFNIK